MIGNFCAKLAMVANFFMFNGKAGYRRQKKNGSPCFALLNSPALKIPVYPDLSCSAKIQALVWFSLMKIMLTPIRFFLMR